jgi:uncharacterized protein (TIGR03086 family)
VPTASEQRSEFVGLLERSVAYALGSVHAVSPAMMSRATPCRSWDLRTLLAHTNDSLAVLCEGADGAIGRPRTDRSTDPLATFRTRATWALGAWSAGPAGPVRIGGATLPSVAVAGAGAIEIAVHGWDIAMATGRYRAIPSSLAEALLSLCPLLVAETGRHPMFGPPVSVHALATPGDRLVALLGRAPV